MPAQRKVFRIEENLHADICGEMPAVSADDEAAQRHHELMTEIMTMRALLNTRMSPAREVAPGDHDARNRATKSVKRKSARRMSSRANSI